MLNEQNVILRTPLMRAPKHALGGINVGSTSLAYLHPTCDHHMVFGVKGDDRGCPPLVCPHGQGSKARRYRQPPLSPM